MAAELEVRRARMIRTWVDRPGLPEVPAIAPEAMARLNVRSRRDRLSIEVSDSMNGRIMFFNMTIAPRVWVEGGEPDVSAGESEMQVSGVGAGPTRVVVTPRTPIPQKPDSMKAKRRALPVVIE
jgi:hypothetical protein